MPLPWISPPPSPFPGWTFLGCYLRRPPPPPPPSPRITPPSNNPLGSLVESSAQARVPLRPSCDSDASDCGPHWAGSEVRGQARPGQSDSDDSDAPDCGLCWPGPVSEGRPDPSRVSERAGEALDQETISHPGMYLANRLFIREHTHTVDAKESPSGAGVVPRGGEGLRSQQAGAVRRRPDAAPGPALDCCDRYRRPPVEGVGMDRVRSEARIPTEAAKRPRLVSLGV